MKTKEYKKTDKASRNSLDVEEFLAGLRFGQKMKTHQKRDLKPYRRQVSRNGIRDMLKKINDHVSRQT